jgi:ALG6, ALG8 glycosyltransferase family
VIFSDFFLIFAAWRFVHSASFLSSTSAPAPGRSTTLSIIPAQKRKNLAVFSMIILNVGLLLVDHIHFQYNGLLMGLLILSFDAANRGNHIMLTVYFSILVLMKHLFVFFVPVFGLYLLRSYCGWNGFSFGINSRIEPFDSISVSKYSCDMPDRIIHYEGSSLTDTAKISFIKPFTAPISSHSRVSGKGKKKKKKQAQQNVTKIIPENKGEAKVIHNDTVGMKCKKIGVRKEIEKKTGFFFQRFFILVCIAAVALTAAFGPFLLDFSNLQGAQSQSVMKAKECRRGSMTDILDEIDGGSMECNDTEGGTETETEAGREIGKRKRILISVEYEQITQIFQRLFPFGRGLVHAYWAPNVWAIYCGIDKTADLILRKRKQIGRVLLLKFRAVHAISKNTFWISNIYLRKFSDYGCYLIRKWDKNDNLMLIGFQISIEIDIIKNHFKSHYRNIREKIVSNFKFIASSKEFKNIKESGTMYLKNRANQTSADGGNLVSSSSGLIGNFRLFILPNISASLALLFTVISMFPAFFVLVYNRRCNGKPISAGDIQSERSCVGSCGNDSEGEEDEAEGVTGTGVGVAVGGIMSVVARDHRVNHTNTNTSSNININIKQKSSIKSANSLVSPILLIRSVLYSSLCSFMLGYHVHEKAILIPMLCAAMISSRSHRDAVLFIKLSVIGIFSLFPLLTGIDELMIKCKSSN